MMKHIETFESFLNEGRSSEMSPRTFYNLFLKKYQKKPGYIGSLLKNAAGQNVFEFELDSISDTKDAKEFLSQNGVSFTESSLDKRNVLVTFDGL